MIDSIFVSTIGWQQPHGTACEHRASCAAFEGSGLVQLQEPLMILQSNSGCHSRAGGASVNLFIGKHADVGGGLLTISIFSIRQDGSIQKTKVFTLRMVDFKLFINRKGRQGGLVAQIYSATEQWLDSRIVSTGSSESHPLPEARTKAGTLWKRTGPQLRPPSHSTKAVTRPHGQWMLT